MTRAGEIDPALLKLAQSAGILTHWEDAAGRPQSVAGSVLRRLLQALGLHCETPAQISESLHQLECDGVMSDGGMVVVREGETPCFRSPVSGRWKLTLESGQTRAGVLKQDRPGRVSLPPVTEQGYHTLSLDCCSLTLAVVPGRCPAVSETAADEPRPWGLVAQTYSLQGMSHGLPAWAQGGNFSAAGSLAAYAAAKGASALALSPAHAMFSADPGRYSPYSPSSRLFLNVCYADPVQVLGADLVSNVLDRWDPAERHRVTVKGQLLDWPRIALLRIRLLRGIFNDFSRQGPVRLKRRFQDFCDRGGVALHNHATYEALHAYHVPGLGPGHGWQEWDKSLRDPSGSAVAQFANLHAQDVKFHMFGQWLAFESRQQAHARSRSAGMSCGLISDLAIGTDPRGSHAWSLQNEILTSVSVGAPPDVYQALGQNWGLTAFSPHGLRRGAYHVFIDTLRANLKHAGGIRIDHIAGMERLWLIPEGLSAAEGAYLTYPKRDLLGLIALEAQRHNTIVIGENLGTVSEELNQSLVSYGMLGTSVLWFERDEGRLPQPSGSQTAQSAMPDQPVTSDQSAKSSQPITPGASAASSQSAQLVSFRPAQEWSRFAIAMPSTHDLPTIHGWWQERDIQWQMLLGRLTRTGQADAQHERAVQRAALWQALQRDGCTPADVRTPPDDTPLNAIVSFVARTPAPLALFSVEDLSGVLDQPNMPGGDVGQRLVNHPNWLQQLPTGAASMFDDATVVRRLEVIRQARSLS